MRSLWSYTEGGRTVTPHAVDEARLLGFLPRLIAASWNKPPPPLPDREGYQEANREVMDDLCGAAASGELLVSRRARYVLDRMYRPAAHEAARAELDEMVRSRFPFAALEKLRAPRIQQILGRLPSRTVGLTLVEAEGEMALVRKHTSRAKAGLLAEELALIRRRIDSGSLDLAEAVAARRSVADEVARVVELERREASRAAHERAARRRS